MGVCCQGFVDNKFLPDMPEYQRPYYPVKSDCSGCAGSWLTSYVPFPNNPITDIPVVVVSKLSRDDFS